MHVFPKLSGKKERSQQLAVLNSAKKPYISMSKEQAGKTLSVLT